MLWCRKCGAAVTDPLMVTEPFVHSELDRQAAETFNIPVCPSCFSELDCADRCECGEWKTTDSEWCQECLEIRNEAVQHCINEIRMQKKLALNTDQIRDLMMTYFD